jgi:hypothetical protein
MTTDTKRRVGHDEAQYAADAIDTQTVFDYIAQQRQLSADARELAQEVLCGFDPVAQELAARIIAATGPTK